MTLQELKEYRHYLIVRLDQIAGNGLELNKNNYQIKLNDIIFETIKNELIKVNSWYIEKSRIAGDTETNKKKK